MSLYPLCPQPDLRHRVCASTYLPRKRACQQARLAALGPARGWCMLRDDIASDPAGRGEDMDREGGAQQNERPSETPRLKSADALARAMRALPRAELEIPRDQLFEDNPRYRALASATGQILWL